MHHVCLHVLLAICFFLLLHGHWPALGQVDRARVINSEWPERMNGRTMCVVNNPSYVRTRHDRALILFFSRRREKTYASVTYCSEGPMMCGITVDRST